MTSNTCKSFGRHYPQIDGITIGGPESSSVTDIYGAAFIDSKIEENIINIINENEDWNDNIFADLQRTKRWKS